MEKSGNEGEDHWDLGEARSPMALPPLLMKDRESGLGTCSGSLGVWRFICKASPRFLESAMRWKKGMEDEEEQRRGEGEENVMKSSPQVRRQEDG
jgi:hypothetical protein